MLTVNAIRHEVTASIVANGGLLVQTPTSEPCAMFASFLQTFRIYPRISSTFRACFFLLVVNVKFSATITISAIRIS